MSRLFENIRTSGFARKIARWTDGDALYGLDNPDNFADIDPSTDPAALNASAPGADIRSIRFPRESITGFCMGRRKRSEFFRAGRPCFFPCLLLSAF